MVPIIELRGGLPVGIASGLSFPAAYIASVIGNLIPVPFIILFIRRIFVLIRNIKSLVCLYLWQSLFRGQAHGPVHWLLPFWI